MQAGPWPVCDTVTVGVIQVVWRHRSIVANAARTLVCVVLMQQQLLLLCCQCDGF